MPMTAPTMRPPRCHAANMIGMAAICLTSLLVVTPVWGVATNNGNGNTTAPSDDPGFSYVGISSTGGASVTYLGNGWCLTASHVTTSNNWNALAVTGKS